MSEEQREELRRFLQDRRARVSPAEAGIRAGPRRRVRGLRREERLRGHAARGRGRPAPLGLGTAVSARAHRPPRPHRRLRAAGAARDRDDEIDRLPADIITVAWEIVACNAAFRRVWDIAPDELPFSAIERLFLAPAARAMHGEEFTANITPVIAMLHSSLGRRHDIEALQNLRDRVLADETVRRIWNEFEITAPHLPNRCTIESPLGTFSYETLNLPIAGALYAIVVQVPDDESRRRL